MKIKFKPNNNIVYMQDMTWYRNIPANIQFVATEIAPDKWKLSSPGYGGEPYGNGAIYTSFGQNLPLLIERAITSRTV